MEENESLKEVKRAVVKEKIVGEYELAKLSENFYKIAKNSGSTGTNYLQKVLHVRRRKIVRLAEQGGVIPKELLPEEEELYNTIRDSCTKFMDNISQ